MDINTQSTNEVVQPEVVTEPVVVTKPSNNWLKMIVLIVLGIGLLAGAVYGGMEIAKLQAPDQKPMVLEPTVVPTPMEETSTEEASPSALPSDASPSAAFLTNWKTYTDTVNGYTFEYPPSFKQIPYSEGDSKGTQVSSSTAGRSLSDGAMVKTLVVATSSAQLFAQHAWQEESNSIKESQSNSTITPMVATMFNGKNAYSYTISDRGNMVEVVIAPLSDTKILRIAGYYAGTEPKLSEYQLQIVQILSTFKFTD